MWLIHSVPQGSSWACCVAARSARLLRLILHLNPQSVVHWMDRTSHRRSSRDHLIDLDDDRCIACWAIHRSAGDVALVVELLWIGVLQTEGRGCIGVRLLAGPLK